MSNLVPGLVSVTFRQRTVKEVIEIAAQAGVCWIEWGGDVHVPPGDMKWARQVGAMTRNAGMVSAALGSYYRVGSSESDFAPTLASAIALQAPLIRVWAGGMSSQTITEAARAAIVADSRRICDRAVAEGIEIAFEFHGGTLTDTVESTRDLLVQVDRPNLRTLWQPLGTATPAERAAEIQQLLPWIANLHVYHGHPGSPGPLCLGEAEWHEILSALAHHDRPVGLLLEFVRAGSSPQFLADAAVLQTWLQKTSIKN